MSYKISMKNGINCTEAQWIKSNNLVDTSVKLAGEEAKDRLYEPKHKKKLVRVLTVIAYVFFVCLAAIMLSLYYVFLWNGGQNKDLPKYTVHPEMQLNCENLMAEMQQQLSDMTEDEISLTSTPEENTTSPDYDLSSENDYAKPSTLIKKLMYKDPYAEND